MAPFRITKPRFLAYFLMEGGLIMGVLYGLAVLTLRLWPEIDDADQRVLTVAVTAVVFTLLLLGTKWANLGDDEGAVREVVIFAVVSIVLGVAFLGLWWAVPVRTTRLSSVLPLEGAVVLPLALALWRWISSKTGLLSASRETVLILGTGETARQVCRWIVNDHSSEYAVIGFVDEGDDRQGTILAMGARIQTSYKALPRFAVARTDRIIVALDEKRGRLPLIQLMELRLRGISIEESTTFIERVSGKISVETMLPSWLIYSEGFKTSAMRSVLKRIADLFLSTILVIVAAPLMLITAVLVKLDSRGPALYRQDRMGLGGKEFSVLKFRSMRHNAEAAGPQWAQKFDARVTRVGAVIRLLRIDELPQLLNVLRGEMSFVGPRPERAHFVNQLKKKIPYFGLRMTVRPGLTGWAQVEYRYGATDEDAVEKLKYDLFYIKNNNLLLDLWIVLKTVKVVLMGAGAR